MNDFPSYIYKDINEYRIESAYDFHKATDLVELNISSFNNVKSNQPGLPDDLESRTNLFIKKREFENAINQPCPTSNSWVMDNNCVSEHLTNNGYSQLAA